MNDSQLQSDFDLGMQSFSQKTSREQLGSG